MWGETLDVTAAMEDMSLRGSIYFRLNLHMHHWASARVAHLTGLSCLSCDMLFSPYTSHTVPVLVLVFVAACCVLCVFALT